MLELRFNQKFQKITLLNYFNFDIYIFISFLIYNVSIYSNLIFQKSINIKIIHVYVCKADH